MEDTPVGYEIAYFTAKSIRIDYRDKPGDLIRETRQRNVLSATGRSPSDPQRGWKAQAVRASGPGGQDRSESCGDADGGDLRAGFLRLLLWLSPWP